MKFPSEPANNCPGLTFTRRVLVFSATSCFLIGATPSPLLPEDAVRSFQVDAGLEVSLAAAEPAVVAPAAVAWDHLGRMFVAENRGYPTGAADGALLGKIAQLIDGNNDGVAEGRIDFATGLSFPNGLLPWNGGFIVTCAPDILFLKDTDDDGKADVREVLLTGFNVEATTQLRVSHPILGPDGWVYLTSGWTGESTVTTPKNPERAPVKVRTDSRFHPTTLAIEPVDGRAQFGHSFDDAGNRFTCFNRVHIQHVVMASNDLQRNPDYSFSETVQNIPETLVPDLIGGAHQNPAARIYPISDNITTADSHAGQFSAACGVTIYRGNGLPADYYGDAFACDPTGNLVHRDKLTTAGATFSARMANEGREFLASRDNWFRPVNLAIGPDGALYICDMYRRTIEHPDYLPEEVRKRTDFEAGKDKGRIWRVAKKGQTRQFTKIDANRGSLITLLGHPNIWQRDTVRGLLLQNDPKESAQQLLRVLPKLEGNAKFSEFMRSANDPVDRSHLQQLNALNTYFATSMSGVNSNSDPQSAFQKENIQAALSPLMRASLADAPSIRTAAFRWMKGISREGIEVSDELLFTWAADPHPQARFAVALLYGNWRFGRSQTALARIARLDGGDRWMRAAILSGLNVRANSFFANLMKEEVGVPSPELMRELGRLNLNPYEGLLGLTDPLSSRKLFGGRQQWEDPGWQYAGLAGMVENLRARNADKEPPALASFVDKTFSDGNAWKVDGKYLRALLENAPSVITNRTTPLAVRQAALVMFTHERGGEAKQLLVDLLQSHTDAEVQATAVREILRVAGEEDIQDLLRVSSWRSFAPGVRATLVGALTSTPQHHPALLQSLEKSELPLTAVPAGARNQLRNSRHPGIKERAQKLFSAGGGDRMKAYETAKAALELPGKSELGREVFSTHCASCHRLNQLGHNVGPDIFGMRNQPKEAILLHVIVPNFEITSGFQAVEIETSDDRSITGLIASEGRSAVTLRQAQGIEETIPRSQIKAFRVTDLSLMPDELEKTVSQQELAHLLAYLKGE